MVNELLWRLTISKQNRADKKGSESFAAYINAVPFRAIHKFIWIRKESVWI